MLKISQVKERPRTVTLQLEGSLAGPWVEETGRSCEPLLASGGRVILDLAEVSFVDSHGVSLLQDLRSRGVELERCSDFIAEQLK